MLRTPTHAVGRNQGSTSQTFAYGLLPRELEPLALVVDGPGECDSACNVRSGCGQARQIGRVYVEVDLRAWELGPQEKLCSFEAVPESRNIVDHQNATDAGIVERQRDFDLLRAA